MAVARSRVVGSVRTRPRPATTAAPFAGSAEVAATSAHPGAVRAQHHPVGHVVALGELPQPMQVAIVVAGEDEAALTPAAQHPPPGVKGGEQQIPELHGGRDEPAQGLDGHPQQRARRHRDAGEEGRLTHQHAELPDEVAGLHHGHDPVVPPVQQAHPAGTYEVEVVRLAVLPQDLAGLGVDDLPDRLQQPQVVLADLGPGLDVDLVAARRGIARPLIRDRDDTHGPKVRDGSGGSVSGWPGWSSCVLVTGGLGMIGAHTARALTDLGHRVVVTSHHRAEVPSFLAGRVTVAPLDVTDRDAFLALADRYEISDIVHLAGSVPDEDPVGFFRRETTGLLNALDAARVRAVRRIAVASSLGVYTGRTEIPWTEELALPAAHLPHLIVAYKKALEPLVTHGLDGSGVRPVVLRIGSTWGPLMDPESPFNRIPPYVSAVLRGERPGRCTPRTAATGATRPTPAGRSPF